MILVEGYLVEDEEFCAQVLQPFVNDIFEILRDRHAVLILVGLVLHLLVLLLIRGVYQERDGTRFAVDFDGLGRVLLLV